MPRNSVIRAIKALDQIGWIHIARRSLSGGGFVNQYSIKWATLKLRVPPDARFPLGLEENPTGTIGSPCVGTQSAQEAPKKPPPPTPQRKPDAGWRKVEEDFGTIGAIRFLVSQYRKDGQSPDDLRRDIRDAYEVVDLPANAGKITSRDGAVFNFLKTGRWPTKDEMLSKASQEEHDACLADMERLRIEADRARQAKSDAYDAKMDILEAEHGDELDAMTDGEMAALIDNHEKASHILAGRAGMFRDELLERLAASRQFTAIG